MLPVFLQAAVGHHLAESGTVREDERGGEEENASPAGSVLGALHQHLRYSGH